ncbi:hypothetical protein [Vannielia litorea]|uniref:hypothetical protein n=1 Tax=Vannielia litorea TaxID=1217970 RepID=UPI001C97C99C|nr:hypothetical protein [Vannielia litorea]MBY6046394.1 hypothetical protein [Vannielia litorea]MBY6073807.1 hypothetical protein [Vannielia litorea]
MSDPMSNVEIEDVLSSIRRLVSENATRPRPQAEAGPPSDSPKADDALVLTPSLRVGDDPETAPEEGAAEEPAIEPAEAEAQDESALDASWAELADSDAPEEGGVEELASQPGAPEDALQSRVAGLEEAFDDGDAFEPDGSEVAASESSYDWDDEDDTDTVIDLSTPDIPAGRLHFTWAEPDDVIDLTPEAPDEAPEPAVSAEAELPEEPALAEAEWEAPQEDLSEEAEAEEDWPEPEEDWTAPDLPLPEEAEAAAMEASAEDAPEAEEIEMEADAPLVFRSSHRAASHAPEPEDAALDGYVISTDARDAATSVEEDDDPWEPEVDHIAFADTLDDLAAPALIDEARLADLVSEVVRAELRGRMGERITQNVRKLVRREIARALETRGIR